MYYIHRDYLIIVPLGIEAFLQVDPLLSLIQKNDAVLCKSRANEFCRSSPKFNKSQVKYTIFQNKKLRQNIS